MRRVPSRTQRVCALAAVALSVAGASACSDHPLDPDGGGLHLQIAVEDSVLTSVGQQRQLILVAHDGLGREADPQFLLWETSDPRIATIDQSGRVTAVRDGMVTVMVRAGEASTASTRVYVRATARAVAWIRAVANPDRSTENNRDSTAVVVHDRRRR